MVFHQVALLLQSDREELFRFASVMVGSASVLQLCVRWVPDLPRLVGCRQKDVAVVGKLPSGSTTLKMKKAGGRKVENRTGDPR